MSPLQDFIVLLHRIIYRENTPDPYDDRGLTVVLRKSSEPEIIQAGRVASHTAGPIDPTQFLPSQFYTTHCSLITWWWHGLCKSGSFDFFTVAQRLGLPLL